MKFIESILSLPNRLVSKECRIEQIELLQFTSTYNLEK